MTIDKARIESLAKDAGERIAYAGETLRDLIGTLAAEGATDYNSEEHKIARKVFSETLAARGRTKNSGLTQYAQAWDAVRVDKPDLGMLERSRKGASRHAADPSGNLSVPSDPNASATTPAPAAMTNAEAIAAARPYIIAQAVAEFLDKHGLTQSRLEQLARDAREVKANAKGIKDKAARKLVGDALFVVQEIGKLLQPAIEDADKLAIEHGFRPAVGPTAIAAPATDGSVTTDEPADASA